MVGSNLLSPKPEYTTNISFEDVVRRIGYIKYYGIKLGDGSYTAVPDNTLNSSDAETIGDSTISTKTIHSRAYFMKVTATFDLIFNRALNLKGTMFFNLPIGQEATLNTQNMTGEISAYHYDGSTATQIGDTENTSEYSYDGNSVIVGTNQVNECVAITPAANATTHFKAGEKLRVIISTYSSSSANGTTSIGHNPTGAGAINKKQAASDKRIITSNITQFLWLLPIKMDI